LYNYYKLEELGIADFEDFNIVYHEINDKLWDRFRKGFISRTEMRWKRMYKTLLHYKVPNEPLAKDMGERYLDYLPQQTHLMPHAVAILEHCRSKGFEQHIITNGFEATQWQKMRNSGIDGFFNKVITSEAAMALKPKPEIYAYALQHAGASLNSSIMIGDALAVDVKGAMDYGMAAIWFNPAGIADASEPRTYEVHSLDELFEIL
jgi:putative hydrolase of the HAD superfamily